MILLHKNAHRYVEMSEADLLLQPISEELKQLARDTKVWQNNAREIVNQKIQNLVKIIVLPLVKLVFLMTTFFTKWVVMQEIGCGHKKV